MPSTVRPGRFLDDAVLVGNVQNSTAKLDGAGRVLVGGRFLDGAVRRRGAGHNVGLDGSARRIVGRRGRPVPRKGIPRPIQKSTLGHLESR
jgi:hypothetical protein